MIKNLKHVAAAVALALAVPAWAVTPTETGELCESDLTADEAMTDCSESYNGTDFGPVVFCDINGEAPNGGCNTTLGTCKCYHVGPNGCLNDYHCNAQSFCNAEFECELNAVPDAGVDAGTDAGVDAGVGSGGGLGGGCSSTGGAMALFPLLLAGLAFRSRRDA
jgi:uncharacterized protein (TIGR03382 family)